MKYVVTGGAGFIGSNLVDSLIDKNNEVHIIDNFLSGKIQNCHPNAILHELDIADEKNLDAIQVIFFWCKYHFSLCSCCKSTAFNSKSNTL